MACVVITGANRGIGLELARQYKERGDEVVAACREPSEALEKTGAEIISGIDVTSRRNLLALAEALGERKIDILVNNAGVLTNESFKDLDFEHMRAQFEVNTLGPLRVTKALFDKLGKGAKVAIVSSKAGSIGDGPSGALYGYRISKAAVNMAGANLAHDLKGEGIAVIMLHPGYVRTDMTGGSGTSDPDEAAAGLIKQIDELTVATTGSFRHANGEGVAW